MKKLIMAFLLTGSFLFFTTTVFAQAATDVDCTGCVGATDLATSAVTGQKIQNSAVTTQKIQNNAVTAAKILDGTIVNADISGTAAIDPAKISGTAWTSANDGSASGLDADTLDGFSSDQFLRNDQAGTITGNLDVAGNINLSGNITSSGDICIGACE